ncbi:MAG: hypothetical protein IJH77_04450, partial [Mogibacterium sp.]|nr:hypothetical protein [Mogibacterium sp.]
MNRFRKLENKLIWIVEKMRTKRTLLMSLSVVVVFVTTYILILPALTLDKEEAAEMGGIDAPTVEAVQAEPETTDTQDPEQTDTPEVTEEQEETTDLVTPAEEPEQAETSGIPEQKETLKPETEQNTAEEGAAEEEPTETADQEFTTGTLSYEGADFTVSAVCNADAELPAGTELTAEEINQKSDEYDEYYQQALEVVQEEAQQSPELNDVGDLQFARFFDISLQADGEEVQPEAAVNVKIAYDKSLPVQEEDHVRILHFVKNEETGKTEVEIVDPENVDLTVKREKMSETSFDAEGFSVYAVVYTVDFSFEIDGKTYDFSINGGDAVGFRQIIKDLGILTNGVKIEGENAELDSRIDELMSNIESVKFSKPKLLWVELVTEDTATWKIMQEHDLLPEYPAGTTDQDFCKIYMREFQAPD